MSLFFSSPVAALPSSLPPRASPPLTPPKEGGDYKLNSLVSFIGFSPLPVVEASPREVSWYCFG